MRIKTAATLPAGLAARHEGNRLVFDSYKLEEEDYKNHKKENGRDHRHLLVLMVLQVMVVECSMGRHEWHTRVTYPLADACVTLGTVVVMS